MTVLLSVGAALGQVVCKLTLALPKSRVILLRIVDALIPGV